MNQIWNLVFVRLSLPRVHGRNVGLHDSASCVLLKCSKALSITARLASAERAESEVRPRVWPDHDYPGSPELERGSGANRHHHLHLPSIAALSKSASRKEFARGKTLIGFSCMVTDHGENVGLFQKTVKRHKLGESTRSGQGAVANVGCLLLSWQVVREGWREGGREGELV